jgi:hypothetical protein
MAGGIELFKLMAKLVLDTGDFDDDIDKSRSKVKGFFGGAESGMTKVASTMNVVSHVGSTVVGVVKGIASAGFGLASAAADMEAMQQSYSEAFRGMEDQATAAFARVSQANNVEVRRLQESGIAFFRQFTSAGMDSNSALNAMESALGYAADAAAAYNISLEDASSMMRSFLRGNVEAGESIGLFINQSDRNRLAGTLFSGKTWEELNEQQRQFALLTHVNSTYSMSRVLGQGAREMSNWSNVLGNLSSAWNDAQAIMGEEIMIALIPALQELTQWIKDNPDLFKSLGSTFGEIAKSFVSAFKELLIFISENKDSIIGFIDGLGKLFKGLQKPPQMTAEEQNAKQRQAAIDYLTGNGTYDAMIKAFGGSNAATEALREQFLSAEEEIPADVAAQWVDDAMADLQRDLDNAHLTANVEIQPTGLDPLISLLSRGASAVSNWFWGDRPSADQAATYNAKGLEYVPYDDYYTRLHRGESVLNRVEASDWRAAQRGGMGGIDPAALGAAVAAAMQGVTVNIDGRTAGALLTPHVSREQGREAWKRR